MNELDDGSERNLTKVAGDTKLLGKKPQQAGRSCQQELHEVQQR